MDIGNLAILVICVILGVWYLVASVYNRRRGQLLARWLQTGIKTLGGRAAYKWIGTAASGLRAAAAGLEKPYKQLNAVLLLESREVLPLWLYQIARGRRDQLILRLALQRPAKVELDAAPRVTPPAAGWTVAQATPALQVATLGPNAERMASAFQPFFQTYGKVIQSFSYRPAEPQIIAVINIHGLETEPCEQIFDTLAKCLKDEGREAARN